mmetsp:Transcript_14546/g.59376  ORF Transcript_14546/g.59376 Transcript_14546/m.59376 type:complete len:244 (-) Transcript_14546:575-1306(-)
MTRTSPGADPPRSAHTPAIPGQSARDDAPFGCKAWLETTDATVATPPMARSRYEPSFAGLGRWTVTASRVGCTASLTRRRSPLGSIAPTTRPPPLSAAPMRDERFAVPGSSPPPSALLFEAPPASSMCDSSSLSRGGPSMRHTCTVPFSELAARSFAPGSSSFDSPAVSFPDSAPKHRHRTLAFTTPLRKDQSFVPCGRQCTRMTVPFADAVASMAPSRVSAQAATGELWQRSSHTTCKLTQS